MTSKTDPERTERQIETGPLRDDPIAIIGIGCRFPGGCDDPESFWQLLAEGRDAVRDVPEDRWNAKAFYDPEPGTPGKTNAVKGGFIDGVDRFDAAFFGISPREAALMDPQQRLLLEVSADALEDAGIPMARVAGTETGVFIGISSYDYAVIQQGQGDRMLIDAHSNTGGALSIAANRISYFFNLRGMSVALDTACSSSMVAVHLACESLKRGEIPLAFAGGVNVLIKPEPWIGFSRLSMLSPDGHCKAFDASANGFVRAEGAGMMLLKPLSMARRDGDRVYALILATGSNQDGRTSSMTVPGQDAQEALLRETCRRAGVAPDEIQYVEAHGTGTLVGDPIEARALGNVYGAGRAAGSDCLLGSVKTNIGHLEPAAGVAGMIKVALAMKHGLIPPTLHFREPNPQIPFEELHVRVLPEISPWPTDGRQLAGVNSFGFGGTNAHVIMEGAPDRELPTAEDRPGASSDLPSLVPLSAKSAEALRAVAQTYEDYLHRCGEGVSLQDIAWATAVRRTPHEHRLAVVAGSKEEFSQALQAYVSEERHPGVVSGRYVSREPPKIVFVCAGQGPQWWGMGRELLTTEPAFRRMIERCDELVRKEGSWSLLEELGRDESASRLQETAIAQPAIFALQVALASLWESWGIRPDAVVGHSVGEVAAAYLAGALALEDAVRVIFHRGRCMDFAAAHGKMLAVGLPPDEANDLLKGREAVVSLAAVNSPSAVTLSGEPEALHEIAQELVHQETFHRFLKVNYAFHSPLMDPMQGELLEALKSIAPTKGSLPMVSTVTGVQLNGRELDADYWWQNVRHAVRFASAIEVLLDDGCDTFVELSPHPVLAANILECDRNRAKARATVLHSLRREEPERATMLRALASLHVSGAPIDWSGATPEGRFIELPHYPWQRERHWSESEDSLRSRLAPHVHPLLGYRIPAAMPTWQNPVDARTLRFLNDHRVQGHVVLPGTCYVEMAAFAIADFYGDGPSIVEELELGRACFLADESPTTIQVVLDPEESAIQIFARGDDPDKPWTKHASGRIRWTPDLSRPEAVDLQSIRERCRREHAGEDCYALLSAMGLGYGASFRGIEKVWSGEREVLGRIVAPPELDRGWDDYRLHPAVLDACLQMIAGLFQRDVPGALGVYLPVAFEQIRIYGRAEKKLWGHARVAEWQSRSVVADVSVLDDAGRPIVEIKGLRCQAVDEARGEGLEDLVYEYEWRLSTRDAAEEDVLTLPAPGLLGEKTRHDAERIERELGLSAVALGLERELDPLCSAFVWKALLDLGASLPPGERFSFGEIAERCAIAPRYHRVVQRHLDMLAADGLLRKVHSEWEVVGAPTESDPESALKTFWFRYPASYAELSLVRRVGAHLAEVLRGKLDPLELIFPEGSLTITDHLYRHSPTMRPYNMIVASAIASVAESLSEGRKLRLLEIGAGTGGLSSHVLSQLPRARTEYVFTDVSNHFFLKAQEQFRDYPFIEYKLLDIEKDPADQDFASSSFDIVLASNVLHATRDLRETVQNVQRLLIPGGLLFLLEGARPVRAMDLIFGLTEGFFRFEDKELRPSHALLSFSGWKSLLEKEGFGDVTFASGEPTDEAQNNVILARRRDSPVAETSVQTPSAHESEAKAAAGRWLVLAVPGWPGERLAEDLRARGGEVVVAIPGEEFRRLDDHRYEVAAANPDDIRRLISQAGPDGASWRGVVHMWNLMAPPLEDTTQESLDRVMVLGNLSVVYLARVLAESQGNTARLWIVTSGAEAVGPDHDPTNASAAPVWGLNRVVMNELPSLRSVSLDLSAAPTEQEIDGLANELLRDDEEDELALRGRLRYVHRWTRVSDRNPRESSRTVTDRAEPFRLESLRPGIMDQLALRSCERPAPGPGQVEIAVAAAGLNFSDVMKALGLYPGLPDGPVPLGIECAGTIERIGEEVSGFEPGDEVIAVTPFSFGTHALAGAALVVRKPGQMSFEQAATVPIAFLTAHYALNHLGRLARGERVLIHSATGGVGLAAIQLAREAGAEVLATAGTKEKRDFLRSLGIQHVMDSRSLDFADEVLQATDGRGVDVVLNSLSGEAIYKGLSILADYGRFLEIGKRDIYQNARIGMRPFRKNLSFMAIDLDRGMRERPELFSSLFREVVGSLGGAGLHPLPHRVFPITNAVSAFRHMAQAKHVGKVVLSLSEHRASIVPAAPSEVRFSEDGTYLISGGLGGFGLATARWIAERGGRHIVLMGRSGAATDEARAGVEQLRQGGIEVKVATADVSIEAQVAAALAEIDATMPPLRGVFHSALVLRDVLLMNLTEEQMRDVWEPKVLGALHLHRLTLGRPIDVFALYSSMSAVFGTGGQGNYASANSFLDSLAVHRKANGLPGLSVSWGFLGETGFVARNKDVAQRFEAMGIRSFSPTQGLTLLGRFLGEGRTLGGVMRVDWRHFEDMAAGRAVSPRFAHLVQLAAEGSEEASRQGGSAFRNALHAASASERRSMLETALRDQVSRVLGVAAEKLDLETPLSDVGLDSLMAIELRNWVEGDLRVNLPAVELLKGPNINQLVDHLLGQLEDKDPAAPPPATVEEIATDTEDVSDRGEAAALLSKVDEMSDAQVDALLEKMEEEQQDRSG